MGPHRLHFWDAGGGRETGNLFGVALLRFHSIPQKNTCHPHFGHFYHSTSTQLCDTYANG